MNETTLHLEQILVRLRQGDERARQELLARAYIRLHRLVAKVLLGSFDQLQKDHEVDSIVNTSWIRLLKALETVQPPTVKDFFRFAGHKVRQVLLDLALEGKQRKAKELGHGPAVEVQDLPDQDHSDPAQLAQWTEFHQKVETLPEEEQRVFEMHYYLDMPQSEIAALLELHPRQVSRLWMAAKEKLAEGVIEREKNK